MKINWKNVIERSGKTFVEGFIGSLVANLTVFQDVYAEDGMWEMALISVGIGAIAAGISAVWNGVLEPLFDITNTDDLVEEELPEEEEVIEESEADGR